ncbi:hypothetical protein LP2241_20519 [Pseudolactococcus piscium]|nr:hypothetical protein LP2241_20519 [Lactococcus piscium]
MTSSCYFVSQMIKSFIIGLIIFQKKYKTIDKPNIKKVAKFAFATFDVSILPHLTTITLHGA